MVNLYYNNYLEIESCLGRKEEHMLNLRKRAFGLCMGITMMTGLIGSTMPYVYAQSPTEYVAQAATEVQTLDPSGFVSKNGGKVSVQDGKVVMEKMGGDHFVLYDKLDHTINQFTMEADVTIQDGSSAALVFGVKDKNLPSASWHAANFNSNNQGDAIRVFRVDGGLSEFSKGDRGELDLSKSLHMKIDVTADGTFVYTLTNPDTGKQVVQEGTIDNWRGGYIGILTFESGAEWSNITLVDNSVELPSNDVSLDNSSGLFKTDLTDMVYSDGEWTVTENGVNAVSSGDSFLKSSKQGSDFVYEADVTFHERKGAASLVFRSNNNNDFKNCYVANINGEGGETRLFKFENDRALDVAVCKTVPVAENNTYHLSITAIGEHLVYAVNGQVVGSTGDYTQNTDDPNIGQNDAILEGYFGLLNYDGNATYQNVRSTVLTEENTPKLTGITADITDGTLAYPLNYQDGQYTCVTYVSNTASAIQLKPEVSEGTEVTITDANGNKVDGTVSLPEKINTFTITLKNPNSGAQTLYRTVICKEEASYYDETYRGQYHYSVKDGWGNDPNGMVYYNGIYHLFYQFYYGGPNWGPMHWAHATSTDLIHWEENPITFYPDEYGTMFSGCAVVDEDNTSGLFEDGEGGLVALITANGNGQRIIVAYSSDGMNWEKTEGVAVDWTEDPLGNRDFRDPKVFRYENKWFMAIAGGPLRIYSSDDLLNWEVESVYPDLHTECPEIYRIKVDGTEEYKWVLNRGGRYYKVGDFKQVDGKWTFVPDEEYKDQDSVMNFGKDSYAAMSYYQGAFDENQKPLIVINWMNTWDDYCNLVDDASGNVVFNGTYNLQLELGLKQDASGKYVLTQTPISQYETLRKDASVILENQVIQPGENVLKDFNGDSYEIVANIKPEAGTTEAGFKVRTGNGQESVISYNFANQTITLDRSKAGKYPTDKFLEPMVQQTVTNPDGSVDLHIYVDRSSVEVFTSDNTVTGAMQIFPDKESTGAELYTVGGNATANVTIYPLSSIWNNELPETPLQVSYRTHVQNEGWQDYVSDGALSGTKGKSLRLEGIEIRLDNNTIGGSVEYRTHVQNEGWQDYVSDGTMSGTKGKSLRLEAIQVRLTGEIAEKYDIYYRTHIQDKGWLGWASNDGKSGSAGLSKRLEAIEIRLVEKGGADPGSTGNADLTNQKTANPTISYRTHVQNEGWQDYVTGGVMSGTKGKSLRLEAIQIQVNGDGLSGNVEYRTHVQNEGWQDYVANGAMSGTKGKSLRLEAIQIRLTGELAQKYSIEYRTHVQNEGWQNWVRDDAMSGTKGKSLRLEAIEIRLVKK